MPRLGVNVDHVATIRQARGTFEPAPVRAAVICELAGADAIVAHLREDRRHMQYRDMELIKEISNIKLNFEMAATEEMVDNALAILPEQVTLVPEKREELTTEGGLNVCRQARKLSGIVETLHKKGIAVSLFIDPAEKQVKASCETGAEAVELHTGRYAEDYSRGRSGDELKKLISMTELAKNLHLDVHAGHGLTYQNARQVAIIGGIEELNIGHTIIARAVLTGLETAVKDMVALLKNS